MYTGLLWNSVIAKMKTPKQAPNSKCLIEINYNMVLGLPGWLSGKESASNTGDMGSVPGLGRSPAEGNEPLPEAPQWALRPTSEAPEATEGTGPWPGPPIPRLSEPIDVARVHSSELCQCLPRRTWQIAEAPEWISHFRASL